VRDQSDQSFWIFNAAVSTAAVGFLAWLLLVREGGGVNDDLAFLPAVNAALNGTAAALLAFGLAAIRRGRREVHKRLMASAFAASVVFLVGYVLYHYAHGDTQYKGLGVVRTVYFTVLITHVGLSIVMLPMILTTFYLAARERFAAHRRLARWTLPIWLYVSVTGVVIYFMLR
jgi:putative membrane protein